MHVWQPEKDGQRQRLFELTSEWPLTHSFQGAVASLTLHDRRPTEADSSRSPMRHISLTSKLKIYAGSKLNIRNDSMRVIQGSVLCVIGDICETVS